MDEAIKSIKAFLYDRTVSPLFGAFIAAWSICNYRVIVALLDRDASFVEKMAFIDSHFDLVNYQILDYSLQVSGKIVHGIVEPILLTLVYLFVYPWLAKPVYKYSLTQQKELRDIKQAADNARLLTAEESRNLIKEIEQLRIIADEDAKKYRERIASLTESITSLESTKTAPSNKPEDSLVVTEKALDLAEFKELAKDKIDALPDVEFELSDLFDQNEWTQLTTPTKSKYGKFFKALVDDGVIDGVVSRGKGAGNQQLYRKESGVFSAKLNDFKSKLLSQYESAINVPENQREELLTKLVTYCVKNNIAVDMFDVLLPLVFAGAEIQISDLQTIVKSKRSTIEIDHLVKKLADRGLVYRNDIEETISLTDAGKELAVVSGLAEIERISRQQKK